MNAYLAVDSEGILVFANAQARRMLDVGEADIGRPFRDLPISYRPTELRSRIEDAHRQARPIRIEHQEYFRPPGDPIRISIEVAPLLIGSANSAATLLTFTDTTANFQLQQDLRAAQESLETTIEELQSANEELETTNEELQSTNEELETTNEELQSTNEELETTNEELRATNEELEATNEELRNQSEAATPTVCTPRRSSAARTACMYCAGSGHDGAVVESWQRACLGAARGGGGRPAIRGTGYRIAGTSACARGSRRHRWRQVG